MCANTPMANNYISCDRDQLYLLPVDIRDWLPEGHLARFILEVVGEIDTSAFHEVHPQWGPGRAAYDPDMMVALLLYSYSRGVRSSRRIEALCETDVAYRVIAANQAPDHGTIARFRARHQDALAALFTHGLALCAKAGLARVGVVALDGTKIAASASLQANATRAEIEAELKALVESMLKDAAETDAAEDVLFGDARGDELPPELADPRSRAARLKRAALELDQKRADKLAKEEAAEAKKIPDRLARAESSRTARRTGNKRPRSLARAKADLKIARQQARTLRKRRQKTEQDAAAKGRKPGGRKPDFSPRVAEAERRLAEAQAKEDAEAAKAVANTTDPDSAVMSTRTGLLQGANAQAVSNEDGIILAAAVTTEANDAKQFVPMVAATKGNLKKAGIKKRVGTVLADAGYASEANLKARGPKRLIATTRSWKLRKRIREEGWREGPPPQGATLIEAMEHLLMTREGAALYAKRSQMIEPVFGQIKEARGMRRFSRRGLSAMDSEWKFMATVHNLMKLYSHTTKLAATAA